MKDHTSPLLSLRNVLSLTWFLVQSLLQLLNCLQFATTYRDSSSAVGVLAWLDDPIIFEVVVLLLQDVEKGMAEIVELVTFRE